MFIYRFSIRYSKCCYTIKQKYINEINTKSEVKNLHFMNEDTQRYAMLTMTRCNRNSMLKYCLKNISMLIFYISSELAFHNVDTT